MNLRQANLLPPPNGMDRTIQETNLIAPCFSVKTVKLKEGDCTVAYRSVLYCTVHAGNRTKLNAGKDARSQGASRPGAHEPAGKWTATVYQYRTIIFTPYVLY